MASRRSPVTIGGHANSSRYCFRVRVQGSTDDTVVLKYGVPGSCNACPDMTFTIVQFQWRGDHVQMIGTPPNLWAGR
jgi:hypothetical protein